MYEAHVMCLPSPDRATPSEITCRAMEKAYGERAGSTGTSYGQELVSNSCLVFFVFILGKCTLSAAVMSTKVSCKLDSYLRASVQ